MPSRRKHSRKVSRRKSTRRKSFRESLRKLKDYSKHKIMRAASWIKDNKKKVVGGLATAALGYYANKKYR
jgi:hypothetical protein